MGDNGTPTKPSSEATMIMLSPDGYYTYLGIPKPKSSADAAVDIDLIKKNYRRLSIKHHPDKPNGDVDTFRLLKRAQMVLSSPRLRQQYDILGIDLDDDEEHYEDHNVGDTDDPTGANGPEPQTTSQGIVHEIASMALTSVLQIAVRTGTVYDFVSVFCSVVFCFSCFVSSDLFFLFFSFFLFFFFLSFFFVQ
jgi:curved DNA-binding protein CbpA